MSDQPSGHRWHDAAALATFTFYEASNSTERWAGGFSSDGGQIEVIAVVDGVEVSVDSSPERRTPSALLRRITIADLLWQHLLEGDDDVALPYSVTIEAEDRLVTVDGEVRTVPGMRIKGRARWVGSLGLGDVIVKITTDSRAPLSLRPCIDFSSLSEFPPHGH
jgi:hypothetical protein